MASRDHPAKRVLSAMMPWRWHPTLVGFRRADVLGALPARRDGSRWNPVNGFLVVYLDSIEKRLLDDSTRMTGCTAPILPR